MKGQIIGSMILITALLIISSGMVTAYSPHQQDTPWNVIISSNNATACNVSYLKYPSNAVVTLNAAMNKDGTSFNYTLAYGNFTGLGDFCAGISCTDGASNEVGSVCREVTPSGYAGTFQLYIIILIILMAVVILGFSIKEAWFVVLGGMGFIMLGVYSLNSGIVGFRDMYMTYGIALFEIAIGTILSVGAGIQKMYED